MKRVLLAAILVLVLGLAWFGWRNFVPPSPAVTTQRPSGAAPASAATATKPHLDPAAAALAASARIRTPKASLVETAAPAQATPRPAQQAQAGYPQMSLTEVLLPNNQFRDSVFGVSTTYPEGWSVRTARRWGENNRENTVFFDPPANSAAVPSMYYQKYPDGQAPTGDAEAKLREMAQFKEASRSHDGTNDYKNDPDSFVFRNIDGHPSLSYFATYSQGDEVRAEYFMRILGPQGYVMFFVRGPVKDVQAVIPDVYRMGTTTTPP